MENVAERVKKVIVEQLGVRPDQVTDDARFIEDLDADSLDTVELVMEFEDAFGELTTDPQAAGASGTSLKVYDSMWFVARYDCFGCLGISGMT